MKKVRSPAPFAKRKVCWKLPRRSVFLDEVGELSLTLQAKLLRVLQEREFVRVGGTRALKLNVRFLALQTRLAKSCGRRELSCGPVSSAKRNFVRVTHCVTMARIFRCSRILRRALRETMQSRCQGISVEAARASPIRLPGNIRELEMHGARRGDRLIQFYLPEDLPKRCWKAHRLPRRLAGYHDAVRNLKKQLILSAFEQGGGSVTEAAKLLGINPNYLHRLIRNLDCAWR